MTFVDRAPLLTNNTFMARLDFSEIEKWAQQQRIKRAETARRLGVSSQTLNGWRLRGQVSADETDRVRKIISSTIAQKAAANSSLLEPALPDNLSPMAQKQLRRIAEAAANEDGKLDEFLGHIADTLEHDPGISHKEVRSIGAKQLSLVRLTQSLAGTLTDAQASAIANLLGALSAMPEEMKDIPMTGSNEPPATLADIREMFVQQARKSGKRLSPQRLDELAQELFDWTRKAKKAPTQERVREKVTSG